MTYLIVILISDLMLFNTVSSDFVNAYYSLYLMMGEGFDADDGQKNWEFVRDNPENTYIYQESEEYAKELKELDDKNPEKLGARIWAIRKNMNLDYNILVQLHNFGEDGVLNWLFVNDHWYETDGNNNHLWWNSWVGKQYGNYLYYANTELEILMGVSAWIEKKYENMIYDLYPF